MGTDPNEPKASGDQTDAPRDPVPVPPPSFAGAGEAPTESLVAGTMGDRCVNCGAPLSSDQRYCINCGERRGAARFTLPVAGVGAAEPAPSTSTRRQPTRRPRPSQGATLIAGIGTLLLAIGVGVLIGHNGSSIKTVQSPHAQVITVNAGGVAAAAGPATTATSQTSTSGHGGSKHASQSKGGGGKSKTASHKAAKSPKPAAPKPTKQEASAAQSAANKVTGGSDVNNAPVTVTSGQSCSGQGCQGGKFTGNFFGGGG
jgi:hypothetical protein